jgi:hypothetical protein
VVLRILPKFSPHFNQIFKISAKLRVFGPKKSAKFFSVVLRNFTKCFSRKIFSPQNYYPVKIPPSRIGLGMDFRLVCREFGDKYAATAF